MRANKSDINNLLLVPDSDDQSVLVTTNIKYRSSTFQDTRGVPGTVYLIIRLYPANPQTNSEYFTSVDHLQWMHRGFTEISKLSPELPFYGS